MKKFPAIPLFLAGLLILAGCASTDFSTNQSGRYDQAAIAVKDFVTVGIVTVSSRETHKASPFGFVRSLDGTRVSFADLMAEASRLGADDIINIRIDVNSNYRTSLADFFTGWTKIYTYTGTALAIKYTTRVDSVNVKEAPRLDGIPSGLQEGAERYGNISGSTMNR